MIGIEKQAVWTGVEGSLDIPVEHATDACELSIVVPCLNEEICIGEFVDWCHQGLRDAGVSGEILIVDSSTDRSPEIAEAHGARVLRVPKRSLDAPTSTQFRMFAEST